MPRLVVAAISSFVCRWKLCEVSGFRCHELKAFVFLGVAPRRLVFGYQRFLEQPIGSSFAGQRSNLNSSQLDVSDLVAEEFVLIPIRWVYRNCGLDLALLSARLPA